MFRYVLIRNVQCNQISNSVIELWFEHCCVSRVKILFFKIIMYTIIRGANLLYLCRSMNYTCVAENVNIKFCKINVINFKIFIPKSPSITNIRIIISLSAGHSSQFNTNVLLVDYRPYI